MSNLLPSHLAFPVSSPANAGAFHGGQPGCPEGYSSENWVDFVSHGHQSDRDACLVLWPHVRLAGQLGGQATMALPDPCGNALRSKAFVDRCRSFAK